MPRRIIHRYNPNLTMRARDLRKNMTEAEKLLWSNIRRKQILGIQFLRQRPIGQYVVDFYAPDLQLVIELDGSQHFTKDGKEYDSERDAFLKGIGLTVMRFTNRDVFNELDPVLKSIFEMCKNIIATGE